MFPTPNAALQRRRHGRKDKPKKKDVLLSSADMQDIKLHQSENAWLPSHKMKERFEGSSGELERESLKRSVQSVLNKLTFQKFQILLVHLKKLNICTEKELGLLADLVYENAIYEPHFSVLYANLCKNLDMIKIPIAEKSEDQVDFITVLLTKSQKEFQEHCNAQENKINIAQEDNTIVSKARDMHLQTSLEKSDLELESTCTPIVNEEYKKNKARRLGNIRFIGELFKLNMILKPVLQECIEILLEKQNEESLECLCLLIKTTGKELEHHGNCSERKEIDDYFVQIQKIVDEQLITTRIRCLLKDILDLRKNNWIPRRVENVPRTIDEIHKEVAHEAHKQWQWYQNMMYISAQSDQQNQAKADTYHNACLCESEKPSTSMNRRKDISDKAKPKIEALDEAKRILLAEGRRGQQSSAKKQAKTKSSGMRSANKTDSASSDSKPQL